MSCAGARRAADLACSPPSRSCCRPCRGPGIPDVRARACVPAGQVKSLAFSYGRVRPSPNHLVAATPDALTHRAGQKTMLFGPHHTWNTRTHTLPAAPSAVTTNPAATSWHGKVKALSGNSSSTTRADLHAAPPRRGLGQAKRPHALADLWTQLACLACQSMCRC